MTRTKLGRHARRLEIFRARLLPALDVASALSGEDQPDAEIDKEASDTAIEPYGELAALDARGKACGGPADKQIPKRTVKVENRAEEEEGERFARCIRVDELRQERQEKQSHFRVQHVREKTLDEYCPQSDGCERNDPPCPTRGTRRESQGDTHVHDVRCAGARWRQSAPHAVDAFAEDNLDRIDALAQNDDIQGLSRRRHPNGDFLVVHTIIDSLARQGRAGVQGVSLSR